MNRLRVSCFATKLKHDISYKEDITNEIKSIKWLDYWSSLVSKVVTTLLVSTEGLPLIQWKVVTKCFEITIAWINTPDCNSFALQS